MRDQINAKQDLSQTKKLAILPKKSNVCADAQTLSDPETIERFCRVWAEVGRAILTRRSKSSE